MSLVVESGLGVTSANTFVSSAYVDTYFSDRGIATWTGSSTVKEAAIIRAGQYLNGLRWKGSRVDYKHVMCWPRLNVPIDDYAPLSGVYGWSNCWPSTEIPEAIKYAQCEAALRYLVGTDMLPDLERGGMVVREKVDVLETEYSGAAPAGTAFQSVMALLRPFLKSSNSVELVRA